MDGIFVCFHNTSEAFAFQYISLEELDSYVYGNTEFSQTMFSVLMKMFNAILDLVKQNHGLTMKVKLNPI